MSDSRLYLYKTRQRVYIWLVDELRTHHSVQDTLSSGLPGIQRHAGLLQQLLVRYINLGLSLDTFLQAVEVFICSQLERVDLRSRHVQNVDDLKQRKAHTSHHSANRMRFTLCCHWILLAVDGFQQQLARFSSHFVKDCLVQRETCILRAGFNLPSCSGSAPALQSTGASWFRSWLCLLAAPDPS